MNVLTFAGSISPSTVMQAVKTGLKPCEQLLIKAEMSKWNLVKTNNIVNQLQPQQTGKTRRKKNV